jgi:hypothetical protein
MAKGEGNGDDARHQRGAVAVKDARQNVPSELVGTEEVGEVRPLHPLYHYLRIRILKADDGREDRERHLKRNERGSKGKELVAGEESGHRDTLGSMTA